MTSLRSPPRPIRFWNREKKAEETELVFGGSALRWLYESYPGQNLVDALLSRKGLSLIYGAYQSSSLSRGKIASFVNKFKINMGDFEPPSTEAYPSFNDFFIRKFRPGARPFEQDPARFPAPAEARYLAFEKVTSDQVFPVKGQYLTSRALFGDSDQAKSAAKIFEEGPMLLARLCPVDYHRFHFPVDCEVIKFWKVPGRLHSVNPWALRYRGDIFATNERHVTLLKAEGFGHLAFIEVGALCVGKIVQSWRCHGSTLSPGRGARPGARKHFIRGEEKGYFLFGGSTVILLGEKGKWRPDSDLLENSSKELETLVRLGRQIALSSEVLAGAGFSANARIDR